MAFTVYFSHSTTPWELAHVFALADEAIRQGLTVYVPDRDWNPYGPIPDHIYAWLSQADLVLLFATAGGLYLDCVNWELSAAPQGRPVIALVEPDVQPQGIPPGNIVWLNREDLVGSMQLALRRLQELKLAKERSNLLAGFLIGALALLVLRALTKKDEEQR